MFGNSTNSETPNTQGNPKEFANHVISNSTLRRSRNVEFFRGVLECMGTLDGVEVTVFNPRSSIVSFICARDWKRDSGMVEWTMCREPIIFDNECLFIPERTSEPKMVVPALTDVPNSIPDKPILPPKHSVIRVFQIYKEQLKKKKLEDLPCDVIVENEEHTRMFRATLLNHPNALSKLGPGMSYIFVRRFIGPNDQENIFTFLKRVDGTEVEFNLVKAYLS